MDAFSLRLSSDRDRLQRLSARSGGKIRLLQAPTDTRPQAELELLYRTAGSRAYPGQSRADTRLRIEFAARYPFTAPVAKITTPILHPNVWESGVVCLGSKWIASEGIDLFVQRIARLISFDPLLVNEQSAANRVALAWYQQTRRQHPSAFPSDQVQWLDEAAGNREIRACPRCQTKLRLPAGKSGVVACPRCAHEFDAQT